MDDSGVKINNNDDAISSFSMSTRRKTSEEEQNRNVQQRTDETIENESINTTIEGRRLEDDCGNFIE